MELRVGDVMTKGVICIDKAESVQIGAELMKDQDIDSLIVTEDGNGIGMVTERDIICKIVAERKDPYKTKIMEAMTSPLITIRPDEDVDDAARIMRDENIRRLVVAEKDNIIGLISDFDITKVEPALHLLIEERSKWDIADLQDLSGGRIAGLCEECDNYSENLISTTG
ncbi:CBS domain-containing protein, partial [Candidatus Altiarchaeota archaeon]